MPTGKSAVAEYMKIRRHILNLTAKAGTESVQLPTALELSKQFGVCRQTVGKALKQLAEDHYVIGKPGLGTFTNPRKQFRPNAWQKAQTIGIIVGDGMVIELDEYLAKLLAACLVEASMFPAYVRTINLTSAKPGDVLRELRSESLDGLIWQNPPARFLPLLEQLRSEMAITVIGFLEGKTLHSVNFDLWRVGYDAGKALLKEGRKQILFLRDELPCSLSVAGLREAFREAGCELNEKLILKGENVLEKLRLIFELGVPIDALFNSLYSYGSLAEIAKESDYDLSRTFQVCWDSTAGHFPEFHGLVYSFDFATLAREAVALLRNQMEKKRGSSESRLLPVPLTPFAKTASGI